ncbi:tyrosine-type recombinase/integrase [Ligilactobacillus faecis]|uniref:Tyrosine-type recombinase/integrase n=1 Tax=Ligilactobacillus faecis TaxID=762833 RepID=A0ABV4DPZ9_9LACO
MPRKKKIYLTDYFDNWIHVYKENAVSDDTLKKYRSALSHLKVIASDVTLNELDRLQYQKILNRYAETHERQTTMDFHHQLKAAILDAYDDALLNRDPTRKVVIKGAPPTPKKRKYLNEFELKLFIRELELSDDPTIDWLLLLIAKTGLRFSEALGLTKADFDFEKQTISISKTWNYKDALGGFKPTKNKSSVRKVQLDWKLSMQFNKLLDSVHGLRHTHASLLILTGVSVASIAKRLGHADISTTQKTYLHIIQELESQDTEKIMRHLSNL